MKDAVAQFLKTIVNHDILKRYEIGHMHFEGDLGKIAEILIGISRVFPQTTQGLDEKYIMSRRCEIIWKDNGKLRIITKKHGDYASFMKEFDQPFPNTYIIENPALWHNLQIAAKEEKDEQRREFDNMCTRFRNSIRYSCFRRVRYVMPSEAVKQFVAIRRNLQPHSQMVAQCNAPTSPSFFSRHN